MRGALGASRPAPTVRMRGSGTRSLCVPSGGPAGRTCQLSSKRTLHDEMPTEGSSEPTAHPAPTCCTTVYASCVLARPRPVQRPAHRGPGKEAALSLYLCGHVCRVQEAVWAPRGVAVCVCVSISSPRLNGAAASVSAPDRRSHGRWSARAASAASAPQQPEFRVQLIAESSRQGKQ